MPSRNQSGKPEHVFQNPSRKRVKSGKKIPNAIKHWHMLCKRAGVEGETLWIKNAKAKCQLKLKKYGVNEAMLQKSN